MQIRRCNVIIDARHGKHSGIRNPSYEMALVRDTSVTVSRNPLVDDGNDTQRTFKSRAASHLDMRGTF